jgi:hypothetical protein
LGEVDLSGVTLESADPRLLDVSVMDLDRHVAMQPSAMAYYGALVKDASRRLATMKRHYERWQKKKYAEAKATMSAGRDKYTVADVEARYIVDNESEIEKYEKQKDKLQYEYDMLSVWFEAWRQKSFTIREFTNITEDERWNVGSSLSRDEQSPKSSQRPTSAAGVQRVRGIIKSRQESK